MCRLVLLVLAGVGGFFLVWVARKHLLCYFSYALGQQTANHLITVLVGLLVFITLWLFRTQDTREQITKTETQIQQAKLFNGLENLTSTEPLKIDLGVAQLMKLAKLNPEHKSEISLAFIRRLKLCPLTPKQKISGPPLDYAQHILRWLIDEVSDLDSRDCHGFDLTWQKFMSTPKPGDEHRFTSICRKFENFVVTWNLNNIGLTQDDYDEAIRGKISLPSLQTVKFMSFIQAR